MATSTIPNPNKVTTLSLTINTSAASGSGTVIVCGRVATLTAKITPINSGVYQLLAYIPDVTNPSGQYEWVKPLQETWLSCNYYHVTGQEEAEAKMLDSGYVQISVPAANKDLKISGSWITKG